MDMPLDILFEVFSYLGPHDVLPLSRATKALRKMLMQRSAAFIWRAALENRQDVPKRPKNMSEPAYVSLIFDTHCQVRVTGPSSFPARSD
ncbi:hypothetical protein BDV98DRAFT_508191 [Pterulicium gracile]|uniref:F-box domain-containing protein n=1 Tax=Pterulicium gracile TaxID=1884261 RepID=A0A5C3QHU2_9AGAR|nr:hypothetical protein BDV98DRAFT_508191 [Pterula gracilis]